MLRLGAGLAATALLAGAATAESASPAPAALKGTIAWTYEGPGETLGAGTIRRSIVASIGERFATTHGAGGLPVSEAYGLDIRVEETQLVPGIDQYRVVDGEPCFVRTWADPTSGTSERTDARGGGLLASLHYAKDGSLDRLLVNGSFSLPTDLRQDRVGSCWPSPQLQPHRPWIPARLSIIRAPPSKHLSRAGFDARSFGIDMDAAPLRVQSVGRWSGRAAPHAEGGTLDVRFTLRRGRPLRGPRCAGRIANVVGTQGRDVLRGTEGSDVIAGRAGDDVIAGGGGHDIICGGAGDDVLRGGPGNDRLLGGPGNDRLFGGRGADRLTGGAAADLCRGGRGADRTRLC